MSIIIDLIILGILGISIFFGYQKGLTKCVIKILSFIIISPIEFFILNNLNVAVIFILLLQLLK